MQLSKKQYFAFSYPIVALNPPYNFTVDGYDPTFKLGYEGEDLNGNVTLCVNETPFNDLAEFKEVVEVPEVGHSTTEQF